MAVSRGLGSSCLDFHEAGQWSSQASPSPLWGTMKLASFRKEEECLLHSLPGPLGASSHLVSSTELQSRQSHFSGGETRPQVRDLPPTLPPRHPEVGPEPKPPLHPGLLRSLLKHQSQSFRSSPALQGTLHPYRWESPTKSGLRRTSRLLTQQKWNCC